MPKALSAESKQLIASLISYFEREKEHGGALLPLTNVRKRIAEALNINISTVSRISKTQKQNLPIEGPLKRKTAKKPITNIDNLTEIAIRNVIYDMYYCKKHITLSTLCMELEMKGIYQGGKTSLRTILYNIGFRWNKDDPRRALMELPRIAESRIDFLAAYMKNKNDSLWDPVFLDETWIFENGTISRSWQDNNSKSVKRLKVDDIFDDSEEDCN